MFRDLHQREPMFDGQRYGKKQLADADNKSTSCRFSDVFMSCASEIQQVI